MLKSLWDRGTNPRPFRELHADESRRVRIYAHFEYIIVFFCKNNGVLSAARRKTHFSTSRAVRGTAPFSERRLGKVGRDDTASWLRRGFQTIELLRGRSGIRVDILKQTIAVDGNVGAELPGHQIW